MKEKLAVSARGLWKRAKEITLEQLVRELPAEAVGKAAAVVLAALCVVPLFVSGTFRMPEEYLAGVANLDYAGVLYAYVIGSYWFRCLLTLGFFAGLLAAFQFAKLYYLGKEETCTRREWLGARLLPVCLSLLLIWSLLSAVLSGDLKLGFLGSDYRQEGVLAYVFYGIVFTAALLPTKKQMRFVAEVLVAVCAFTGILVITGGKLIPGLFYLEEDLRAVMFHQYNHYGYFLAICTPLCMGLLLQDENPGLLLRLLRMVEFWLISNAVAFNSVRGAFLAIGAMLVVWNVIILWNHRGRWKRLLLVDLIFAATILFLNTGSTLLDRLGVLVRQMEDVQEAIASTEPAGQQNMSAALDEIGSDRGILWRLGIQFALERPVFGYGPDNLGALYRMHRADLSDRPHNELIQIAASLGLPALVFYLTGLGSLLVRFFKRLKQLSVFELAVFASVGGYLVSSLFGNTMYYTTPYFYMMLAFAYRVSAEK